MGFDFPLEYLPEGIAEIEHHLYSIIGLISHEPSAKRAVVFGGYFRYNPESKQIDDGQLVDFWGESEIPHFGFMDDKDLEFDKHYIRENYTIHFKYRKNEKGLWEGEYDGGEITGRGLTQCLTSLIDKKAYLMLCGRRR